LAAASPATVPPDSDELQAQNRAKIARQSFSFHLAAWNECVPRSAGFRFILRRFTGNRWNPDEMITTGALDLPAGICFVASQVLLAMGTIKF